MGGNAFAGLPEHAAMSRDSREQREREFHNRSYEGSTRNTAAGFYDVSVNTWACYRRLLYQGVEGLDVLEYGCGMGSHAFELARKGARVTGIDVSDLAIQRARERAVREGLSIRFLVMNAESLGFAESSFDLVCGVAILHHLDLHAAYRELARVSRPDGRCVFVETLGHNPLISLYRLLTPHLRTKDEHPLVTEDLALAGEHFHTVDAFFLNLTTLLSILARRSRAFEPVRVRLEKLDRVLFASLPFTRRYAWDVVMSLSVPRKAAQSG